MVLRPTLLIALVSLAAAAALPSLPPASTATTICSKETPRSSLSCSFFSGPQRNGFTAQV